MPHFESSPLLAQIDVTHYKVLLVEDSPVDALLIRRLLERSENGLFQPIWVKSLREARDELRRSVIHIILLDLNLIDSVDLDTYEEISRAAPDIPIVVLTSHDDRDKGFEAIRQGAQDYLIKGRVETEPLLRSLLYAMERKRLELADRKQAELSLKESEGKYQQLFEYESDAVVVLDIDLQRFEEVNHAAVVLFGYSREEFSQIPPEKLSAEKDKTRAHLEQVRLSERGTVGYQIPVRQFRKKSGQVFSGEIAVRTYVAGGRLKLIASIRDITERLRMEKALRKSETRFRMLVEHAADALFLFSISGEVLDVNQSACDSLGYSRDELLGRSRRDFVVGAKLDLEHIWMKLDAVQSLTWEGQHQRKDDSLFPVEVRFARFYSEESPLLLALARDVTARKQEEARRFFHAYHDPLTRLPNRTSFLQRVEEMVEEASLGRLEFAVLFIDLDRFKKINDSLGHDAGDQLIIETGARLKRLLRPGDVLARLNADEFAILYQLRSELDLIQLEDAIREEMAQPFVIRSQDAFCSASLGIALSETGYTHPHEILRDAEIAVHRAKEAGRARTVTFDKVMRDEAIRLHHLEIDLRRAIERDEFVVYYQPIVDLQSGRLNGFEALVRWQHPEQGLLSPAHFISLAEDSGLIVPLGEIVLRQACRQTQDWNARFGDRCPVQISVNVASIQFERRGFVPTIEAVLEESGLPNTLLKLEMTESSLIEHSKDSNHVITTLHEKGIPLVMDDFGTGYSSLAYLHRFPVYGLKIDRTFVSRMQPGDNNTEIVRTIIALSRALGVQVIAEGVESPQQLEQLRGLGCDAAQGFLLAPPMPAKAAESLLEVWPSW